VDTETLVLFYNCTRTSTCLIYRYSLPLWKEVVLVVLCSVDVDEGGRVVSHRGRTASFNPIADGKEIP